MLTNFKYTLKTGKAKRTMLTVPTVETLHATSLTCNVSTTIPVDCICHLPIVSDCLKYISLFSRIRFRRG